MTLTNDDIANILAALRYWQERQPYSTRRKAEHFEGDPAAAYDDDDIDDLCERINVEEE